MVMGSAGAERPQVLLHLRRIGLESANLLMNRRVVWRAVGVINRRVGFLRSVFLVYPATPDYGRSYAYPRRERKVRWNPWPVGLLWQNGRLVFMVAVSVTDEDFLAPGAVHNLGVLERNVEEIRRLLGAPQKSFAGILPGVMARHKILRDPPERDLAARMVLQAIGAVQDASVSGTLPVIVLGGQGFIGSRVVELSDPLYETYAVDVVDGRDPWPAELEGSPAILVNVANRQALGRIGERLWPGMVIINEVYPEPRGRLLADLIDRGVEVRHIVGVRAGALPPFPAGYRGAIPCCAAWPSPDAEVVVRALG